MRLCPTLLKTMKTVMVRETRLTTFDDLFTSRVDDIFDIPFAVPLDGAVDTLVIKSDVNWTDLRFQLAEAMMKPASKLSVGYKFSTDARNTAPNCLATGVHLLELIEGAKDGLEAAARAKTKVKAAGKKPKPFKVEIIDLDAGKEKGKAKKESSSKSKRKKKVHLWTLALDHD